jgi:hypothetical protein
VSWGVGLRTCDTWQTVFDIFFEAGDPVPVDEDGWLGLPGRSVFGTFTESFVAPLGWWSRGDYERQWLEGAGRLAAGMQQSAFVLEPGWLWWIAWLDGDRVFIQQRLLVAPEMAEARAARPNAVPYDNVGARNTRSSDGDPLSQWAVSVVDVRAFLDRRALESEHHAPPG